MGEGNEKWGKGRKVIFLKMASRSYNAVQVLDLLDADSSDSGSRGEKGDDI